MTTATLPTPSAAVPQARFDLRPLALLASLAALALPAVGHPGTWVTLTVAGLAMGMIIFLVASGLTLVFGLMDVLNFGHGVFIALGAYVAMTTMLALGAWVGSESLWLNAAAVLAAMLAAAAIVAVSGLVFERLLVRPVYGMPLRQILVTMGGLIIGEELIKVFWGPTSWPCRCRRRCAVLSRSAMRRSRSTGCWRSLSAASSSRRCCGC